MAQFFAQLVVEIDQRFIEQHQVGVLDQRPRHGRALLLATGQLRRLTRKKLLDMQHLGDLVHAAADFLRRHARQLQRRGDVVVDAQARVVDELLIDHRDVALAHWTAGHVLAVHHDAPVTGHIETRHQAHQRRLAGQGASQQHIEGAGLEGQVHPVDMGLAANPAGDRLKAQGHGAVSSGESHRGKDTANHCRVFTPTW